MNAPVAFLGSTYSDALGLVVEARNYLAQLPPAKPGDPAHIRLQISFESMRVTARLTQVMAWLLARKAVHAGEITREEADGEAYRLAPRDICLDSASSENLDLPPGLRSLLERSHRLYLRVYRLDAMSRGERV